MPEITTQAGEKVQELFDERYCKYCGSPTIKAVDRAGYIVSIDRQVTHGGPLVLVRVDDGQQSYLRVVPSLEWGLERYQQHECPRLPKKLRKRLH